MINMLHTLTFINQDSEKVKNLPRVNILLTFIDYDDKAGVQRHQK